MEITLMSRNYTNSRGQRCTTGPRGGSICSVGRNYGGGGSSYPSGGGGGSRGGSRGGSGGGSGSSSVTGVYGPPAPISGRGWTRNVVGSMAYQMHPELNPPFVKGHDIRTDVYHGTYQQRIGGPFGNSHKYYAHAPLKKCYYDGKVHPTIERELKDKAPFSYIVHDSEPVALRMLKQEYNHHMQQIYDATEFIHPLVDAMRLRMANKLKDKVEKYVIDHPIPCLPIPEGDYHQWDPEGDDGE